MEHSASEMGGLLLVVRLFVAATFALAGFGKLLDPTYARVGMRRYGVPERWLLPTVLAVSVFELVVALGLVTAAYSWLSSIVAALLLLGSVSIVAANGGRGVVEDCRCFGRLFSLPTNV